MHGGRRRRSLAPFGAAIGVACAVAVGGAGALLGTAGAVEDAADSGCHPATSTPATSEPATSEPVETTEPTTSTTAPSEPAESTTQEPPASCETSEPSTSQASEPAASTTSQQQPSEPAATSTAPAPSASASESGTDSRPRAARSAQPRALRGAVQRPAAPASTEWPPASAPASAPAAAQPPRIPLEAGVRALAVSAHVPEFGLLADGGPVDGAQSSPGSAEALSERGPARIGGPELAAVCVLAVACGLLARRWTVRARRY